MSGLAPAWVPTHVQVTVLRARGLRAKAPAGGGGSDAYTVMALGRDKFSTSVAERCQGQPVWREEATFELPPPARPAALRLTVLHRALVGLDKFLGRAEVDLAALRADGGRRHSRWYKLRSKPGKKEKERGEIEVDIQFMRSNMTASMFDLSAKDKSRSPFGKLKDKLKGKRSSGFSDTASAIVPSATHSPADSEDEAAEKEKEKKKSKLKTLFSKPGLQKTSLSQSMSVLPTLQPVSTRVRLHPRDFHPHWDDEDSEASPTSEQAFGNALEEKSSPSPSPVFKSRKMATLDSRNQGAASHPKKEGLSLFSGLKSKGDPVSKSSLCINGSHVYMEESTAKDSTPASSPSPRNLRRRQLCASEENLPARSSMAPEAGGVPPGHAFSGSVSLETFKAMTLPSYKLLTSEEHPETSTPPSAELIKEPKKADHKKSALLSLVTGKKEAAKTTDAENIPDRTLRDEENKVPEEESEQEAECLEPPAGVSSGDPCGAAHRADGAFTEKQPLNPFEEERKPDRAAVPARTGAVKPRPGMTSEEETQATLPALAPDSLPAFLSVHRTGGDNNPFISKTGQKVQVPGSENITSSAAPATSPPPFASELSNGKNPFAPARDRASAAPDPEGFPRFPSPLHPAASAPKAPFPRELSARGNNPFAGEWAQSPWGQGPASPGTQPCRGPALPSDRHFGDNNPFVPKPGREADAPGFEAVAGSSPLCPPGDESRSSAERGRAGRDAPGCSADAAVAPDVPADAAVAPDVPAVSPAPGSPSRGPGPAPGQRGSAGLQAEGSVVRRAAGGSAVSGVGRAAGEGSVTPQLSPRLVGTLNKRTAGSGAAQLGGDVPSAGRGVEPAPGLPVPDDRAPDARGCLPQSGSSEAVAPLVILRDNSSNRLLKNGGDDDLFDCLTNFRSAIAITVEHGPKLAGLPVIPEGGSDDELLGDCQENHGHKNLSETGKGSPDLMPEPAGSSAAAQAAPAGGGGAGGGGRAPGTGEPSEPPARVDVHGVGAADSGSGVTSHSRECNSYLERRELKIEAGAEERAERDCFEPSASSSSLSNPSQPYSSSRPLLSDPLSRRAESPKKPTAEGFADKAGNSGEKKLLQARVSACDASPARGQQGGEPASPKHRLHPVKPMNTTANKSQTKNLNVISTMGDKLLEMKVKKYDPSDPAYAYAQLTHDELIQLVLKQKDTISRKDMQVRELEDYIDNLLVRVMEETPNILRVSTSNNRKAGKM